MAFTGTETCGNSPKNLFVAHFEENLFAGDEDALAEVIADDCVLETVAAGSVRTARGREAVVSRLLGLSGTGPEAGGLVVGRPDSGHLEAAITHGRAAAAWGHWDFADGSEQVFSHAMWFTNLKARGFSSLRIFAEVVADRADV